MSLLNLEHLPTFSCHSDRHMCGVLFAPSMTGPIRWFFTVTRCNTLHHTALHCTTLMLAMHHTDAGASICVESTIGSLYDWPDTVIFYWNTLQHAATRCNTLQHAATHCNTLQNMHHTDAQASMCVGSYLLSVWYGISVWVYIYSTCAHVLRNRLGACLLG